MIFHGILAVLKFFDLKIYTIDLELYASFESRRRPIHEFGKNRLCSDPSAHITLRVQQMRYKIQWQSQDQSIPLLRSVFVPGIRPINISRKLTRYRNMSQLASRKIIPCGLSGPSIEINALRCQ
jgi:hypothetical protein